MATLVVTGIWTLGVDPVGPAGGGVWSQWAGLIQVYPAGT